MTKGRYASEIIEPGQEWTIDLLKPEDAEGVRRLFLGIYGEGYPIKTYIEPEQLIAANAAGAIISSVARTARRDIVGHNALYQSAPYKGVYEMGAGLVHKDYQGGKSIFTDLVAHGIEHGRNKLYVEAAFGEGVCNHLITQTMSHKMGFRCYAIEVDLMPASAYAKTGSAAGRVSSLFDFMTLKPKYHRIYLPEVYEEALRFIYASLDDERDICLAAGEFDRQTATSMNAEYFSYAQVARFAVKSAGDDFEAVFATKEQALLDQGAEILQVSINLSESWVSRPVAYLRNRGYFLCGIQPRWLDEDALLMIKTIHRPCWEDMQLLLDRSKRIVSIARNDWQLVSEGKHFN